MESRAQRGEDRIIADLLTKLGITLGHAVEIGAMPGYQFSNIRELPEGIEKRYVDCDDNGYNLVWRVTAENVIDLLDHLWVPQDFAVLSIDIDGNDYWVWKAIEEYEPSIVVIEMNPSLTGRQTVAYDPDLVFKKTNYYGASFDALIALGDTKGYAPYFCNSLNIIFVHRRHLDLLGTLQPVTYTPNRGWPPEKIRKFVAV